MSFVQLRCPLTKKLPADPVTIDGKSFERDAFIRHVCIQSNGLYKGRYLRVEHIVTDSLLLEQIQKFLKDSDDKRLTLDWKKRRKWVLADQKFVPKYLDLLTKIKTSRRVKAKARVKLITENYSLHVNEARAWLNANSPQKAYEYCYAQKLHEVDDTDCFLLMGDVYAALSDNHNAFAFYKKIKKKSERARVDIYWSFAQLHRKANNGARVIKFHIDGIMNLKGQPRARHLLQLAEIYRDGTFGTQDVEVAEPYFKKAARLDRTGDVHMILANVYFEQGEEKFEEYSKQIKSAAKKGHSEAKVIRQKQLSLIYQPNVAPPVEVYI
jgi:tetratricopeptide (TPR) repeat protein